MLKKNPRRDSNEKVVSTWKQYMVENNVKIEKQRKKQNMALVSHKFLIHFFYFIQTFLSIDTHTRGFHTHWDTIKPTFEDQNISKVFFSQMSWQSPWMLLL